MKWITLVAALGACIALTSCDNPDQVQHTARKTSAAVPATCPCHPGQSQSAAASGTSTKVVAAGRHHSMHGHKHGANGTYSMDLSAPDHASSKHGVHRWRAASAGADHRGHGMRAWHHDETRINGAVLVRDDHGVRIWHGRPGMGPHTVQYARYGHDWRHRGVESRSAYYAPSERYAHNWHEHYTPAWPHRYSRTDFTAGVLVPYNYVSHSQVSYVDQGASYSRSYTRRDTIPATMSGARLDPWHGYDVDCPRQ